MKTRPKPLLHKVTKKRILFDTKNDIQNYRCYYKLLPSRKSKNQLEVQVGSWGKSPAYINFPEIELVTMARRFYACMGNMILNGTITGKDILP